MRHFKVPPFSELRRSRRHRKRGFSLIEVLVAFSIFALVAVTVLEMFGVGVGNVTAARDVTRAVFVADSKLQEAAMHVVSGQPGNHRWQGRTDGFEWQAVAEREETPPGRTALYRISISVAVPDRAPVNLQTWRTVPIDAP